MIALLSQPTAQNTMPMPSKLSCALVNNRSSSGPSEACSIAWARSARLLSLLNLGMERWRVSPERQKSRTEREVLNPHSSLAKLRAVRITRTKMSNTMALHKCFLARSFNAMALAIESTSPTKAFRAPKSRALLRNGVTAQC